VPAARPRLTRDRVLGAAVALADREGAEALTVRRLADDLGVHPTSLYNHVPSKVAILDGVVERMFSELPAPDPQHGWQDWVREFALAFRDLARAHPGAFMVLSRRPAENDAAYDMTERGIDAFARGGFSTLQAVLAVRAVSLAVLGLALNECPPMGEWVAPAAADSAWLERPRLREIVEQDLGNGDAHWGVLVEALVLGLQPGG